METMTNPYKNAGNDPLDETRGFEPAAPSHETQQPVAEPERVPAATEETTKSGKKAKKDVQGSIAGTTWVGLIIGALLLILLLVFIMQNQESVELQLFAWSMNFPIGVGMLIAAITGALIMAIVGGLRILQLRKQVKK